VFGAWPSHSTQKRWAVLLLAGDKSGGEKRFYRELIRKADDRFDAHLQRLRRERK
jgi:hypothetical protein